MKRLALVSALLLCLGTAWPASAIVYGEPDRGRHPNVGAVVAAFTDPETGEQHLQPICTGTLVDEDVVVSAAHCYELPIPVDGFFFTLAEVVDRNRDGLVDAGVRLRSGNPVTHPRFGTPAASNPYDLAVFLLDRNVAGVEPAPLPRAGLLDSRVVRDRTFEAVGYGVVRETRRGAQQGFLPGGRRMTARQTVLSVTKAWINFSMNQATGNGGTCYGDSGGPHFLGDVIVSVTVTGDAMCKALDRTYRLDTPWARQFLSRFMTLR